MVLESKIDKQGITQSVVNFSTSKGEGRCKGAWGAYSKKMTKRQDTKKQADVQQ